MALTLLDLPPASKAVAPDAVDPIALDRCDYERAVVLLREGRLRDGSHLLGNVARRTRDEGLRSQCLFNLGEVLEQLGQVEQAYATWYTLAHKPAPQRNDFDRKARIRVMQLFDAAGLRLQPPDFPSRVQVEVTNRCNLRCIMCTRNQMTRSTGDMTPETFRRVADEVCTEPGCVLAMYFLGEPLLNPCLEEMVRYVAERADPAMVFGIQTNGMLLGADRARGLLEAGLRSFAISLDALQGDLERIRPGARYPQIEQNILGLIETARQMGISNLRVDISKLCDDPNADEVKRFKERWEGKVSAIHLLGISRIEGNSYLGADSTVRLVEPRPQVQKGYCGQGQRVLVHWNGDYAFCCSDVNRRIVLGSVLGARIRELWHSPLVQQLRHKILTGDYSNLPACADCMAGRR
jgi:molybdenum cofactor biosynthesis enzyme MoaA